jgi:hypothetical protein
MSAISWKYNTDGVWSNAANWSGGVLPGAADDVTLATLSAHTVTYSSGSTQIHSLTATTDSLNISAGSLGILGTASFAKLLEVSGGTLSLLGTSESVSGTLAALSGQILLASGNVFTVSGTAGIDSATGGAGPNLDGPGTLSTLGTTTIGQTNGGNYDALILGGGVTWNIGATVNDAGQIGVGDSTGGSATLVNAAGLTFTLTSDSAGIFNSGYYNQFGTYVYGTSSFSNAGTLAKTGGTATSTIASVFTNTGLINAATGTIAFSGGGSFGGTLAGAGAIAFTSGTATLSNAAGISVANLLVSGAAVGITTPLSYAGSFALNAGDLTLSGAANSIAQFSEDGYAASLTLNGASLALQNATLGAGTIDSSGTGTVSLSGTTALGGYSGYSFYLGGGVKFANAGVVNQSGTLYVDYLSGSGFSVSNAAGATYNVTGDYSLGYNNANGTSSSFTNAGTFAKSGGTGVTQVESVFSNTGVVSAATGTIEFDGGGNFAGTLAGAGTIAFAGGADSFANGLVTSGAGDILFDGGTITLGGNETYLTSQLSEVNGRVLLGGHTLAAASASLGGGVIDGAGTVNLTGTSTLSGNDGSGILSLGGGVRLSNTGVVNQNYYLYVDYQSGAGFTMGNAAGAAYYINGNYDLGDSSSGVTSAFSNAGKFIKAAGTNTSYIYSTFTNASTGTITATTGTIEFDGGATLAGSLNGTASISFASATTLSAGVSLSVANLNIYNNATVTLAGNTRYAGDFTFSNGYLNLSGNTLTLAAPNLNNGTIDGPGTLSLTGTTSLASSGFYFGGGANIVNNGTVDQNGYTYVSYQSGAGFTVQNLAGSTWDLTNSYSLGANNINGTSSTFVNAGTLTQTGATTYSLVYSVFDSTGTVSVNGSGNAEIAFESGGVFGGTFTGTGLISLQYSTYIVGGLTETATAHTEFYQSTIDLTSAITFNGTLVANGSYSEINLGGQTFTLATLDLAEAGSTQYFDQGGTLSTTGTGSIVDWYNNGPMISFGSGSTWVNAGTITDAGLVQLGDNSLYNGSSAGTLVNTAGAVFAFSSDDGAIRQGNNNGTQGAFLTNAGLLEKTGGTATSNVNATLTSTGTLATTSGTLAFDDGGTVSGQIADSSSIAFNSGSFGFGALTIGGGAAVSNAVRITQTGALTFGDSSNVAAAFTNNGTYVIAADVGIASAGSAASTFANNGLLEKTAATGRSQIAAAIVNSGTIIAASGTLALTGSVAGTGTMLIGAGNTLELSGAIASSQTVSYTSATGTLLVDTPATASETVTSMTVGDVIDVAGITATKATVNANDQLVIVNGSTTVAAVQLSGSYLSDTFTVASDGNGGEKVTLSAASTAWKGTSNDWFSTNVWTNAPPNAGTAATIALSGAYTLTLNGGETAAASTLAFTAAHADFILNGTLDITKTFQATAGTLSVGGTINGGIFVSNGTTVTFNGGTLENLQYRGTINLSANYANVSLAGTDSFSGAAGTGAGTINLPGYQTTLSADGYETLANAAINLGSSTSGTAFLRSNDTNGQGAILTLGSSIALTHTGTNAQLSDSGNAYDAVYNDGKITAALAGGTFTVTGNDFENDGTIAISNGDIFNLDSAQSVNTKTLTVSSATLGIDGAFVNTGSATATKSVLNFNTSLTGTELTAIVAGGGNTLNLAGSLDEQGGTLSVGPAAKIVSLNLSGDILNATINPTAGAFLFSNGATLDNDTFNGTISVGSGVAVTIADTLTNAVIADSGNGVLFAPDAELNKVTYDGTLSMLSGSSIEVLGGLTLNGTGGTGVGAISASAGTTMSTLYVLDTETLSNVVITSGTGAGPGTLGLFLSPSVAAGGTLTLAATTSFDVVAGTTAGFFSESPTSGAALNNAIVSSGLISVGAGATFLGSDGSVAQFTNAGSILLATGAEWLAPPGPLTAATFANIGTIALGTNTVMQTNGGAMANAGQMTLASGALFTAQGAFSETGTTTVAAGARFDIEGATTLASVAGISGAGTLGINGVLNLASGTFDMAAAGRITNVEIGGNLESGIFSNDAGTVTFGTLATLTSMTWKGPLAIGPGSTVDVVGALTVQTAAGGVPGVVTLTGNASAGGTLAYVAGGSLANLTINSSSAAQSSAGIANVLDIGAASGALTLGATFTLNAVSGGTEIADIPATGTPTGTLTNSGHLNATGGTIWLDPSFTNVTNAGTIALSADAAFDATPGAVAANQIFANTGHVTMAMLSDFDLLGSGANSGVMTLAAGSEMSFGSSFTNTGSITLSNGSSLTIGGTMISAGGHITASGTSSDFVSATAGTATAFNGGTLSGGVWTVSAASTLTLNSGNAVTVDAADIVLTGANSVLRSVGSTIARLESSLTSIGAAGTLSLLASRGYSTTLKLADSGTVQLQGGTLSTGGLTIAAAGLLTGSGVAAGAIANAGTIDATGGTLTLSGAVNGAGILQIESGAELDIGAANSETVLFNAGTAELRLDTPASFAGTLSGFQATDSILLASTTATAAVLSGSRLTVTLSGGTTEIFKVAGNSATVTLTTASDGRGDTLITYPAAGSHAKAGPIRFIVPATAPASAPALTTIGPMLTDFASPLAGLHGAGAAGFANAFATSEMTHALGALLGDHAHAIGAANGALLTAGRA